MWCYNWGSTSAQPDSLMLPHTRSHQDTTTLLSQKYLTFSLLIVFWDADHGRVQKTRANLEACSNKNCFLYILINKSCGRPCVVLNTWSLYIMSNIYEKKIANVFKISCKHAQKDFVLLKSLVSSFCLISFYKKLQIELKMIFSLVLGKRNEASLNFWGLLCLQCHKLWHVRKWCSCIHEVTDNPV